MIEELFYTNDRVEILFSVVDRRNGKPSIPTGTVTARAKKDATIVNATVTKDGSDVYVVFPQNSFVAPGFWDVQVSEDRGGGPETLFFGKLNVRQGVSPMGEPVVTFDLTLNGDTLTAGNGSLTLAGDILEVA